MPFVEIAGGLFLGMFRFVAWVVLIAAAVLWRSLSVLP